MSTKTDLPLDMSNPQQKHLILSMIRGLEGMHRFQISKYHKRRTPRQNRYYWPCFAIPFADFLRGQGHGVSDDDAHEILKSRFLKRSIVNKKTGEMMEYTLSTTELSTVEFNKYLDSIAAFLLDYAGIQVPEPDVYRERE